MSLWDQVPGFKAPPNPHNFKGSEQYMYATFEYLKSLANSAAIMAKGIEEILNGRIDAKNIRAESIETRNLKAGSITTDKIEAGAVTADKISVNELSAITANLGHITAGLIEAVQIFGSYIATANGTFPRVELSSDSNLMRAYYDSDRYVALSPNTTGAPAYVIYDAGLKFWMQHIAGAVGLLATTEMQITTSFGDLKLSASGNITVPSWSKFRTDPGGRSLQQELNDIWNAIDNLEDRVSALEGP